VTGPSHFSPPTSPAAAGGLRRRLLGAFAVVAVVPLLLFSAFVMSLVSRSLDSTATERLAAGLRATEDRLAVLRKRAADQVSAVVERDLTRVWPSDESDRDIADEIAARRELAVLEIVDRSSGRLVSSHHWPAGFGLADKDLVFGEDPSLRIEKVGEGYGLVEKLALVAERGATWRGQPVVVRGGSFLDAAWLADLGALMGADVGLHESLRGSWIAPAGSPFLSWPPEAPRPPAGAAPGSIRGRATIGGRAYRWAAVALHPSLALVVAAPEGELERTTTTVRNLTLGMGVGALCAALAFSAILSARVARPIRELARAAERVAAGDLSVSVSAPTGDEVGGLARAFNAMTAELRDSRERLLQAERVAAWREMARRLAHELKNPLFPIQVSIETLRRSFERDGGAARREFGDLFEESSRTILEELRSLRGIIDEFSQFARLPRPDPRPLDINAVVEQALGLYQARAASLVVERDLAAGLPAVAGDPDLLGRVFANLIANAIEAMPDGGTLRVRTRLVAAAVAVEIEDTGPGLDEEQRSRLFTPYYTTKKAGTGLGLAIVQSIVSDHGGRVEVRSAPGQGTTFAVLLPVHDPGASFVRSLKSE
jgi:two-component system, NtrC family, nitrogen regulation sensor histidine kinase NtrY